MTFEAKYGGRCGVCDERIKPGDWVAYSDDVVVHEDCDSSDSGRCRTRHPMCPKCYMEPALNGRCGCDE